MLRTFDPFREFATAPASGVDYDVVRAEDSIELRVDIPGINPDDVDITVDGRTLRLEATRDVSTDEGTELVSRRRRSTTLRHTFQLSDQ
ncbi:MAG: Hsp20/alpha crystallin family protein, partial [Acidimicrobiales bacterium]